MNEREVHKPRSGLSPSPYTFNIYTGPDSHDSFGGNSYSDILTTDRSAGVFGNIDQFGNPPGECQHSISGGESQEGELRKRKSGSFDEPIPKDDSSSNRSPREMDSQYLTPCSGGNSRETSISRTRSLSTSSSIIVDDPVSTSVDPEQRLFRKDTASWFEQGKVFEVSRKTPTVITNAGISGCPLLVVIYRRDSSITCLPLRRHSAITRRNIDFLKSRIRIYAKGKTPVDPLPECPWKPLPIDVDAESEALDDMWINIDRPHTIENIQDVEVAQWGVLDDESFATLSEAYLSSQLRSISNPREKPQATVLWHLRFIFGRIWAGLVWIFQR